MTATAGSAGSRAPRFFTESQNITRGDLSVLVMPRWMTPKSSRKIENGLVTS